MIAATAAVEGRLALLVRAVDRALDGRLPAASEPPTRLHEAMRYSVFGGGKRLRPALAILACEALGGRRAVAMPAACALEMIHTYSLIHDDLPSMDDDDYRRGRPSCHRAFDEATAILAGDALQAEAFGTIARHLRRPALAAALTAELAAAAGSRGMVGGQVFDLSGNSRTDAEGLDRIHRMKTAAMFRGAARMGALSAGASPVWVNRLGTFGERLGLAFQIVDDILDVSGTASELGKTPGKDSAQDKATYPARFGVEPSRRRADLLSRQALKAVAPLGKKGRSLAALAEFVVGRSR
ncbi:MAG TPA: farnesyl diphosphate synthase [Planctomycetota bacterium]|nr:farnesyl diphosphate synthase [Planctomycetota bacterium]